MREREASKLEIKRALAKFRSDAQLRE
jgi:hypothetical protein